MRSPRPAAISSGTPPSRVAWLALRRGACPAPGCGCPRPVAWPARASSAGSAARGAPPPAQSHPAATQRSAATSDHTSATTAWRKGEQRHRSVGAAPRSPHTEEANLTGSQKRLAHLEDVRVLQHAHLVHHLRQLLLQQPAASEAAAAHPACRPRAAARSTRAAPTQLGTRPHPGVATGANRTPADSPPGAAAVTGSSRQRPAAPGARPATHPETSCCSACTRAASRSHSAALSQGAYPAPAEAPGAPDAEDDDEEEDGPRCCSATRCASCEICGRTRTTTTRQLGA